MLFEFVKPVASLLLSVLNLIDALDTIRFEKQHVGRVSCGFELLSVAYGFKYPCWLCWRAMWGSFKACWHLYLVGLRLVRFYSRYNFQLVFEFKLKTQWPLGQQDPDVGV